MKTQSSAKPFEMIRLSAALFMVLALWLLVSFAAHAAQLTLKVIGVAPDGTQTDITATADYRWTVEEDATKASIPGRPADTSNYSFSFHTSYMPVLAAGRGGAASKDAPTQDPDVLRLYSQALPDLDTNKRYYVSVAAVGYQMGGAPVVLNAGGASATVYLNQYDLPTAQISIFVFNDNSPINGAPDLPQETGLAGFHVRLIEAGGTYGMSGGEVTQDAFANPLGTTYNQDGSVKVKGTGLIKTDANGVALIQNLYPAKYTILVAPPAGSDWHQTSTIEGTKGIDAWVKNNEPSFFQEFGPPGHHVFIGFTSSGKLFADTRAAGPGPTMPCTQGTTGCTPLNALTGGSTVSGRIVNTHNSRPPVYTFFKGAPVDNCWVGLNEANAGRALYAAPCSKDSTFSIPDVPPGTYELVVWDEPLDMIIATTTVTVGNAALALGDVPVSSWFARYQGRVFQDIDGTGSPKFEVNFTGKYIRRDQATGKEYEVDCAASPPAIAPEGVALPTVRELCPLAGDLKPPFGSGIASNIRFRDGSIYQSVATKDDGTFGFTEVFPFFNWMIAEIDFARFKATGATTVVDGGGVIDPVANKAILWDAPKGLFGSTDPAFAYDPWGRLNPLAGACTADDVAAHLSGCTAVDQTKYYSTDQGVVLTYGMQTFLGQTNHIEWGKQPYGFERNGGIAGIVQYGITRAEDDPRYAAAEPWEPGIPRVQMNLFIDCDGDGRPDKPNSLGNGQCDALSSADYIYDKPDVDNYPFGWRDGGTMGAEDQCRSRACLAVTTGPKPFSQGDAFVWGPAGQQQVGIGTTDSWDDNLPGGCPDPTPYSVPSTGERLDCFDGLRNFNQVRPALFDGGFGFGSVAGQPELPVYLGEQGKGTYIVEAVAPPGYLHQGNGDKNVVFGDSLKPSPAALPHECVGLELDVPPFLTLFPGQANPNYDAGQRKWRKCDMKAVPLNQGQNAAPNFFMYTEAPVAGHGVGFILDDTATEFNQFAPTFGEKYSPPHLPVSIQDWTGREISRVYSDQFGSYNFLVPSTFTINPPYPSGVMPSMMVACMNHPGPIADPNDQTKQIIDPYFNRNYTQFCYTLQYLPGKTTYLDTPVLPISAFASVDKNPLDCECEHGTPTIYSATNGVHGPWVPSTGGVLTIVSQGQVDVVNPAYDPTVLWPVPATLPPGYSGATGADDPRLQKTIQRDYGFGPTQGTVMLGSTPLAIVNGSWSANGAQVVLPGGLTSGQQLTIKRGDNGKTSAVGLTVHVGGPSPIQVNPNAAAGCNAGVCKTIQDAVDTSVAGDLITIWPGAYKEYVILDKRVRLQGWGAGSVAIDAGKSATNGLKAWRAKINARAGNTFDLLPGQTLGIDPANNEPLLFGAEEGPGVLVVGRMANGSPDQCRDTGDNLRVDGLTVTGSDAGGGILASGYACNLQVTNNRVVANYGTYGGGIRIGHTTLLAGDNTFTDAVNRNVRIHHNWIAQNGATEAGGGGGITLGTGSDNYVVADNYVCGNFSMADGGGLSHLGRGNANNALHTIAHNKFIFNQTFNQSADPMGGGVSISGQIPVGGGASDGTGDVKVDGNLIQGNQSGAGAGGGVSIARTVGADDVVVTNNMIVNNVAAYAGGGVALTLTQGNNGVRLVNNTVASNVSTATNRQSWGATGPVRDAAGNVQPSVPQVAGIAMLSSNAPTLLNNILWANRQYIYLIEGTTTGLFNPGTTNVASPNGTAAYADLGFAGTAQGLGNVRPRYSVFTDTPANRASFDAGLTGCTNTTPTTGNYGCNRFEPAGSTSLVVKPNNFQSITDPNQPVFLADATVNLQSALTFDETGNFINVIFSPLTLWELPGTSNAGAPRANYHLADASIAKDNGRTRNTGNAIGANQVPLNDIDGDARTAAVDIGADEIPPPPMHVGDLDWTAATVNATLWRATVTVHVEDANHVAVSNATVTGAWSAGDTNGRLLTCTTDAAGNCFVTSGRVTAANNKTVSFTVSNVTSTAFSYLSSANHDPDAAPQASDGTQITAAPTFWMHVGDLDWTSANTSATQWSASVIVTVHDVSHAAVGSAAVAVTWTGGGSGGASCTTDAAGQCTVTRTGLSRANAANAVATVTGVTRSGNATLYTSVDNHDPDVAPQNSNGTTTTVPRP